MPFSDDMLASDGLTTAAYLIYLHSNKIKRKFLSEEEEGKCLFQSIINC